MKYLQSKGYTKRHKYLSPLDEAGFTQIHVSPPIAYVDASCPQLVEGFMKNTFDAMVQGIRNHAIHAGLINVTTFDKGIRGLQRTTEPDGVFCYTFFKAFAQK